MRALPPVLIRPLAFVLLLVACLLAARAAATPVAAQTPEGQISGSVRPGGFALVTWGGGSVEALVRAAGEGCRVRSVWATREGRLHGYIEGAPAHVNRAFLDLYPGGVMPVEPVIVVCEAAASGRRAIEGTDCVLFPDDNPWAMPVTDLAVHPNSDGYLQDILSTGGTGFLHADFGSNPDYGIPFTVVPADQPRVPVSFDYDDESDPGPYPIPADAAVEAGSDRHVLVLTRGECRLYELFDARRDGAGWRAGSGAIFDLRSNRLRPDGWTSADAAGLPIFAGLARYDEVQSGRIDHALRFTVRRTQRGYIHPATHFASSVTDPDAPPMGLRLRLRDDFDLSGYTGDARVILEALREYGMILADNGSNWYISGATDPRWDDDDLNQLKTVPGSAFEVVDTGAIRGR